MSASSDGIALTIGAFDGVHRGHQDLISRMAADAATKDLATVCMTFDPDPAVVVHPEREHRSLSTPEERIELIRALGVGQVDVEAFTLAVAALAPNDFVDRLLTRYSLRALWVGPDFALGRNRAGGEDLLRTLGARHGFEVTAVEPLRHDGRPISSTWIREVLAAGDVELAAVLLGRPYSIRGSVITGMKRGRTMGFPTANVAPPLGRALPADGVYLVRVAGRAVHGPSAGNTAPVEAAVEAQDSRLPSPHFGVVNLGSRPTFGEAERLLEAHLLDFSGDLYGAALDVAFLQRIRGIQRFSGIDELREQIARDIGRARELSRSF
jgi:riboflavin kinase/FMN adenylyltransferase